MTEEQILADRWEKKKANLETLANSIHRLRHNISTDLKSEDEKIFLTALVIAIMDKTGERVGNASSAGKGHHGVTGFKKSHIKINDNEVTLTYMGKSGVDHEKCFTDERIANALKEAIDSSPNENVFVTTAGLQISANIINRYLKEFSVTAKDVRGYAANVWIIEKLKTLDVSADEKERKHQFNKVVKSVAAKIGHGATTLRKHYMVPELPEHFIATGEIVELKDLGYYTSGGVVVGGKQADSVSKGGSAAVKPPSVVSTIAAPEKMEVGGLFHGSPYSFDKFNLNKIGSGEGANAYGYGIYFTSLKKVAEKYAETGALSKVVLILRNEFGRNHPDYDKHVLRAIDQYGHDNIIKYAERQFEDKAFLVRFKDLINEYGRIYQVTLHKGKQPSEYDWLLWDKPLSKSQIEKIVIRFAIEAYKGRVIYKNGKLFKVWGATDEIKKGSDFYYALEGDAGFDKKAASLFLLRAGIDGIKYPEYGKTKDVITGFNYVVFDENAVTIDKQRGFEKGGKIEFNLNSKGSYHYGEQYKAGSVGVGGDVKRKPILFEDKNGNKIVFKKGDYRISVDDENYARNIVLWHREEVNGKEYWAKRGVLNANIKESRYSEEGDKDFEKYLSISEVEIEKDHRGQGLSTQLYKALIDYSWNDVKAILSYTPSRVNKTQVPKIWKKLGGRTSKFSEDYQIIDINRKPKAVEQSLKAQPKAGSVGVGGDALSFVVDKINGKVTDIQKKFVGEGNVLARVVGKGIEIKVGDNRIGVTLKEGSKMITLGRIAVEKEGTGIGRRFIDELKNYADITGKTIAAEQVSNTKFFKQNGFEKEGQDWYYTPKPKAVEQSLKETPKAGSVGVGGDVEATTKALNEITKKDKWGLEELKAKLMNVIYHGSDRDINKFDEGVTYFGKSREAAEGYGGDNGYLHSLQLEIKKPYKLSSDEQHEVDNWNLTQAKKEIQKLKEQGYDAIVSKSGEIIAAFYPEKGTVVKERQIAEAYQKAKADGSNPELVKAVENALKAQPKEESKPTSEKSILNQETDLKGGSITESEAFKKWFKDSKVVDKRGKPMIVYHGSPDLRGLKSEHIFKTRNQAFDMPDSTPAYYFTDSLSIAKSYADPYRAFDYQGAEEGIVSLYLSIQNPLIVDAENQLWRKFEVEIDGTKITGTRELIGFAHNKKYDGMIVKNVIDYYNKNEAKSNGGNVYVAFSPSQIKLADGTNATFDSANLDIRFKKGGKVEFELNSKGGYDYEGEAEEIATEAQIITLPKNIKGTNCGNCVFRRNNFCDHKEVTLSITDRMCCAFWSDKSPLSYIENVFNADFGAYTSETNAVLNGRGGYDYSGEEIERAKQADLLTLPENVIGTNCSNCKFWESNSKKGYCNHPKINLPVNDRMSCGWWDNADAIRQWGKATERTFYEQGGTVDSEMFKKWKSVNTMTKSELKKFYSSKEGKELDKQTYNKWKSLVNMSKGELEKFYNSQEGKEAGLTPSEAKEKGIDSGRESARWIMKMKNTSVSEWTPAMWKWAKKQISFISRMRGNKGGLYDDKGNKTRKHTSLLIWGHNPEINKFKQGGIIKDKADIPEEEIYTFAYDGDGIFDFDKAKPFLKKWFDKNIIKTAGSGTQGVVYLTDSGTALKITHSLKDALFNSALIGKKLKYNAAIFSVKQLGDYKVFIIEREFIKDALISDEYHYLWEMMRDIETISKADNIAFEEALEQHNSHDYRGKLPLTIEEKNKIKEFYETYLKIKKEFLSHGLKPNDFTKDNMGIKNGKLICFDCQYELGGEIEETKEFWGSAAAGVLLVCKTTGRMLLLHRSEYVYEPLTWGIISGKLDENETPTQAALSELEEETGLAENEIKKIQLKPSYIYENGNFRFYNFIGLINKEFAPKLNWKNTDYRWCEFNELPKPLHFGVAKLLEQITKSGKHEFKTGVMKGKVNLKEWNKRNVHIADKVELLPLDVIDKYKEFDRMANPVWGVEYINNLQAQIVENGITTPLTFSFGVEDNKLSLGEGNHRLAIAKELGYTHLPVYVKLYRKNAKGKIAEPSRKFAYESIYDDNGKLVRGKEFEVKPSEIVGLNDKMAKGGVVNKGISASVSAAIDDIIKAKNINLTAMPASMLYKLVKDHLADRGIEELTLDSSTEFFEFYSITPTDFEKAILKTLFEKKYIETFEDWIKSKQGYYNGSADFDEIALTPEAYNFYVQVNERVKTRVGVKYGFDLSPNEAGLGTGLKTAADVEVKYIAARPVKKAIVSAEIKKFIQEAQDIADYIALVETAAEKKRFVQELNDVIEFIALEDEVTAKELKKKYADVLLSSQSEKNIQELAEIISKNHDKLGSVDRLGNIEGFLTPQQNKDFYNSNSDFDTYVAELYYADKLRKEDEEKLFKLTPSNHKKFEEGGSLDYFNDGVTVGENDEHAKFPTLEEVYELIDSEESRQGNHLVPDEGEEYDEDYHRYKNRADAMKYAQEVYDIFSSMPEKIPIYRAVKAHDVDLRPYHIGESWSFDLSSAKEFGSYAGGNKIISGYVDRGNVDWDATIRAWVNFSSLGDGESEFEITVPGANKKTGVMVDDIKIVKPRKGEHFFQQAESDLKEGGTLDLGNYEKRVIENMKYMGTDYKEWKSIPVLMFQTTKNDKGEEVSMPVFDFPKGYEHAKSLFPSDTTGISQMNCELCGKPPIKTVYWIQNDLKKLTLAVGSECVKYVGDGSSGKENVRKAKIELAKILDNDLSKLASLIAKLYRRKRDIGYGRTSIEWGDSYVGQADESWIGGKLKEQLTAIHAIGTDLLFEKKKYPTKNDSIWWGYVYKALPVFNWPGELECVKRGSNTQETAEKNLLAWFTRKGDYATKLLAQASGVLKITHPEVEYFSDYLKAQELPEEEKLAQGGAVKKLGYSGKKIIMVPANPAQTFKGITNWLASEKIPYTFDLSRTTSSRYIEFIDKNGTIVKVRIANHSPALDDVSDHKGVTLMLYFTGEMDIEIDTSFGYKTEDVKTILSAAKKTHDALIDNASVKKAIKNLYDAILKNKYRPDWIAEDVLINAGIENDEYDIAKMLIGQMIEAEQGTDEFKAFEKAKKEELRQKESTGIIAFTASNGLKINTGGSKVYSSWRFDYSDFIAAHGRNFTDKFYNNLHKEAIAELNIKIKQETVIGFMGNEKLAQGGAVADEINIGEPTNAGVVEDKTATQFKVDGKWYHKSLIKRVLKNEDIRVNSIISKLKRERGEGFITLYHGTDNKSYENILNTGTVGVGSGITFFTKSKSEAKQYAKNKSKYRNVDGYGKVIEITMPRYAIKKNAATGEYETEFSLQKKGEVYEPTKAALLLEYEN